MQQTAAPGAERTIAFHCAGNSAFEFISDLAAVASAGVGGHGWSPWVGSHRTCVERGVTWVIGADLPSLPASPVGLRRTGRATARRGLEFSAAGWGGAARDRE